MKMLTRYIGSRFLLYFVGAAALLSGLIFMIDFVELLRQSGKYKSVSIMTLLHIGALRLPAYIEIFLPFSALCATVGTYLSLARSSELTVIRSSGMSVWQFLAPCLVLSFLIGALGTTVFNPVAAEFRAKAELIRVKVFERRKNLLHRTGTGMWLRQDGTDGASVLQSAHVAYSGTRMSHAVFFQYAPDGSFLQRIDARAAFLKDGYWELRRSWISRKGQPPEYKKSYKVPTYLTKKQVTNTLGSVISVSFWKLPDYIDQVRKAGLKATDFSMQYATLLTRPFLLVVVVLLAATVSLRAFRFGKIQTMVVTGMVAGFGFFLLQEVSRQIGAAGLVSPMTAAVVPLVVAGSLSLTVLLHQEDG